MRAPPRNCSTLPQARDHGGTGVIPRISELVRFLRKLWTWSNGVSHSPCAAGTYMALASAPTFMATLISGAMSGWLLETFCPAKGAGRDRGCTGLRSTTRIVREVRAVDCLEQFANAWNSVLSPKI